MKNSEQILEQTINAAKYCLNSQRYDEVDKVIASSWQSNVMRQIRLDAMSNQQNVFGHNWLWNFAVGVAAVAIMIVTVVVYFETNSSINSIDDSNIYSTVLEHSEKNDEVVLNDYLGVNLNGE
ncbi:hypothetical protein AAEX28_03745 [Lentisphaerota bacterium WC36G]|nr:hypothetical protein LJT99_06620 [Lentisphaerae bacterium WC36]